MSGPLVTWIMYQYLYDYTFICLLLKGIFPYEMSFYQNPVTYCNTAIYHNTVKHNMKYGIGRYCIKDPLTCAGSWADRTGGRLSDTGFLLLVVTFDAVSASPSVELCIELIFLVEKLLFLYDTTPTVFVAVTERNYYDFKH